MPASKKVKQPDEIEESWIATSSYILTTKGGLVPVSVMKAEEKKEDKAKSTQLKEVATYIEQNDLIPLPFEADSLLFLKDNCSYFDACVKQIAKDVIGQGYTIELREGMKELPKEKERILNFIKNSGGDRDETFEETLERGVVDWGCIGWWGWEVSRATTGKNKRQVNGLWHVPAQTIRVHKDHDKYCQVRGDKKVWFKRFGQKDEIDLHSGKTLTEERMQEEKDNPEDKDKKIERANEMLFYRNYYPQSDYYGAPNILPSVGSAIALIGVRDYNLAFFENYGVPAALIILKGRWDKASAKKICDFLDVEIKGSDNAHKTMAIHPSKDSEFIFEKLSMEVKEGSFDKYQKTLRDEILVVYKMPPYRIGIAEVGKLGGSTASEATRIYVASVVTPLEKAVERLVTDKLFVEGLGVKNYTFNLNELDVRDLDAIAKRDQLYFQMGALTPNQILKRQGKETYTEGDQYYVGSAFIPVGEEPAEKMNATMIAALEELKAKVNAIAEGK
ncbi:MAG: phage portal protein [Desulfobacteraceae bacterium]|nr:phage portal protein [Desulfobacteraceae bacterium]